MSKLLHNDSKTQFQCRFLISGRFPNTLLHTMALKRHVKAPYAGYCVMTVGFPLFRRTPVQKVQPWVRTRGVSYLLFSSSVGCQYPLRIFESWLALCQQIIRLSTDKQFFFFFLFSSAQSVSFVRIFFFSYMSKLSWW